MQSKFELSGTTHHWIDPRNLQGLFTTYPFRNTYGKFANNNKFERFTGIEATPVDEFDKACEVHDKCYSLLIEPHSEKCPLPGEIYWKMYDWDYRYDKTNDVSTKC